MKKKSRNRCIYGHFISNREEQSIMRRFRDNFDDK